MKQKKYTIKDSCNQIKDFVIYPKNFFKKRKQENKKGLKKNIITVLILFIIFNLIEIIVKTKQSTIEKILINNFIYLPIIFLIFYGFYAIFQRAFNNKFEIKESIILFININLYYLLISSILTNFLPIATKYIIINLIITVYILYHFITSTKEIFNTKYSQIIVTTIIYLTTISLFLILIMLIISQQSINNLLI